MDIGSRKIPIGTNAKMQDRTGSEKKTILRICRVYLTGIYENLK